MQEVELENLKPSATEAEAGGVSNTGAPTAEVQPPVREHSLTQKAKSKPTQAFPAHGHGPLQRIAKELAREERGLSKQLKPLVHDYNSSEDISGHEYAVSESDDASIVSNHGRAESLNSLTQSVNDLSVLLGEETLSQSGFTFDADENKEADSEYPSGDDEFDEQLTKQILTAHDLVAHLLEKPLPSKSSEELSRVFSNLLVALTDDYIDDTIQLIERDGVPAFQNMLRQLDLKKGESLLSLNSEAVENAGSATNVSQNTEAKETAASSSTPDAKPSASHATLIEPEDILAWRLFEKANKNDLVLEDRAIRQLVYSLQRRNQPEKALHALESLGKTFWDKSHYQLAIALYFQMKPRNLQAAQALVNEYRGRLRRGVTEQQKDNATDEADDIDEYYQEQQSESRWRDILDRYNETQSLTGINQQVAPIHQTSGQHQRELDIAMVAVATIYNHFEYGWSLLDKLRNLDRDSSLVGAKLLRAALRKAANLEDKLMWEARAWAFWADFLRLLKQDHNLDLVGDEEEHESSLKRRGSTNQSIAAAASTAQAPALSTSPTNGQVPASNTQPNSITSTKNVNGRPAPGHFRLTAGSAAQVFWTFLQVAKKSAQVSGRAEKLARVRAELVSCPLFRPTSVSHQRLHRRLIGVCDAMALQIQKNPTE